MNLDDIKDQLRDQLNTVWSRVQESSAYNTLREKYEALPAPQQKALGIGGLVFAVLFLLWFPYSYISSSSDLMLEFSEKRALIRELLRVSRQSQAQAPIPQGPSLDSLQQAVDNIFNTANLMPEQRGQVMSVSPQGGLAIIPPSVTQQAFSVDVKKLNLKQIVDIGFELSRTFSAMKLMDLDIQPASGAPAPGYFDVIYKLVSYNFPHMGSSDDEPGAGGRGSSAGKRPAPPRPSRTPPPETLPAEEMPAPEGE